MAAVGEEMVTLEGLAREIREGFKAVNERLDSIDRCLDEDFGPRLQGMQEAVRRIEDGLSDE